MSWRVEIGTNILLTKKKWRWHHINFHFWIQKDLMANPHPKFLEITGHRNGFLLFEKREGFQ